jgi:hypothetical protein
MGKGAKIIAASAAAGLLGFGLCGSVPGEIRYSWRLTAGIILIIGSLIGIVSGGVIFVQERRDKPRPK